MRAVTLQTGLIVVIVFGLSQQAAAQLTDFLTSPGYSAMISNGINNNIYNRSLAASQKGRTQSSQRGSTSASRQTDYNEVPAYRKYPVVQFKPTGTRITLQEYLDSVNIGQREKAELKALVLDIWNAHETEAARKGYPNDLALALVSSIELNGHVYNGKTEKILLPLGQNIGSRDVIAEYVTDQGTFNSLTDRQKQELYELFVMLGGLTYHYYQKALRENNAEEIKSAKLTAAQNLKLLGVKP